ncbi:MAG TPA: hypothetical protein VK841_06805, partial [Polyangiaceae bacterium]|nr:hypothetical protein [Polyangiaceae bacterium]
MRREFVWSGVVGLASVVAAAGYGCGENSSGNCSDNATCPPNDATAPMPDGGEGTPEASGTDDGGVDATLDGGSDGSAVDGSVAADAGDAGNATPATDGSDGSQCDPNGDPSTNPCAVDETNGVFVSANTGMNDAGTAGTASSPWKTISEGIAAAAAAGKGRVYIC